MAPAFCANRMVKEYADRLYFPPAPKPEPAAAFVESDPPTPS